MSDYPSGVADGPQIEANIQYVLNNFNSVYGTPYKVKRILVPPSTGGNYPDNGGYYRTYSNNVFINKTVLLPTYRQEYDTTAIRVLEEALPGYNIVPIDVDNSGENLISLSGAIHCITHTIGVNDPLLISHQELEDTYDDINPYVVSAEIQHKTGISSATLFYKNNSLGTSYTAINMINSSGNLWTANIPAQFAGTEISYYIHAESNSGKQLSRPIVAPQGSWSFDVLNVNGIHELSHSTIELLDVFPNPASAITCIPMESAITCYGKISLKDIAGKELKVIHNGEIPRGESKYFFSADNYAPGSYLVVVNAGNDVRTKKVMIK